MEPVGDLLGDQGSVASGAVVDNDIYLDLLLYGVIQDFDDIFDLPRIRQQFC